MRQAGVLHALVPSVLAWMVGGCASSEPPAQDAVAHGQWLFSQVSASPSPSNAYTCATCHAVGAAQASRILPGANLGGVTHRTSFWGGQVRDLLPAINQCRYWFMGAQAPWREMDEAARAMWAYLDQLPGEATATVPFGVQGAVVDLAPGNPTAGVQVFAQACANCHGAVGSGTGRISKLAPLLPSQFLASHKTYTVVDRRLAFIEKVRHGPFFGYGGTMPPFAMQVLTDAQLADLIALMEL